MIDPTIVFNYRTRETSLIGAQASMSIIKTLTDACTQTPFPGSDEILDRNPFVRSPIKPTPTPGVTGIKQARAESSVC